MAKMIYVNLPVTDLVMATSFYQAIGMTRIEQFSNEQASAMRWSEEISFMLLGHAFYQTFTGKQIADAHKTSEVLLCLSRDSRSDVDAIVEAGRRHRAAPAAGHGLHVRSRVRGSRRPHLRADVDGCRRDECRRRIVHHRVKRGGGLPAPASTPKHDQTRT